MAKPKPKIFKDLTSQYVRRIAAVADLHVGSEYAVFPPNIETRAGNEIMLNAAQMELFGYWCAFIDFCAGWNCDSVFLAGDLNEGQDEKGRGENIIQTDLNLQIDATTRLLRPLCRERKVRAVRGSQYHNSLKNCSVEKIIVDKLTQDPDAFGDTVKLLQIKPTESIVCLSHGGSGAVVYRESAQAREYLFGRLALANQKLPNIRLYVHGHWHWYDYIEYEECASLQLPGWKIYSPSPMAVKWYTRWQPTIGGCVILVRPDGTFRVEKKLYPLPHNTDKVGGF